LWGYTRTLAFSRPLSGTDWSTVPLVDREREARAFHRRVLQLFRRGLAIRCPVVARVSPSARGLKVDRFRDAKAQDQGLLELLEARGDRLRRCRHCGAWFWRERKREYCQSCFQSGTARSEVRSTERRRRRRRAGGLSNTFHPYATGPVSEQDGPRTPSLRGPCRWPSSGPWSSVRPKP